MSLPVMSKTILNAVEDSFNKGWKEQDIRKSLRTERLNLSEEQIDRYIFLAKSKMLTIRERFGVVVDPHGNPAREFTTWKSFIKWKENHEKQ